MKTDSIHWFRSQWHHCPRGTIRWVSHFCLLLLVPSLFASDEEIELPPIVKVEKVQTQAQYNLSESSVPIRAALPMQASGLEPVKLELDKSWRRRDIREIRIDIREKAEVAPQDRSVELDYGDGIWMDQFTEPTVFNWVAPDIYYAQLYFEDVSLERYGQTSGPYRQFIRSGIHFYRAVATLPNKYRNARPYELESPLGFCRPGSPAPLTRTKHYHSLHR